MERVEGKISKLMHEKKSGFISIEGSDEKYYFQLTHSPKLNYESLIEGQKITFLAGNESNHGNKFANDVEIFEIKVDTESIKNDKKEASIFTAQKDLTFIEKILYIFGEIENQKKADEFEDSVFVLLRCLGIHNLYQFDRKNQSGQADGFFILGNLAVIYDCTLRDNFENYKEEQIRNYRNKLNNESQLTISVKRTDGGTTKKEMQISGKNRQVWIITKNKTREIGDYNGIKVKEVSINDIIKILSTKLSSGIFEEEDLSARLTLIDRT
jgi:cold shock CspA family protein